MLATERGVIALILLAAVLFAAPVCAAESDPWQSPVFEASQCFGIPENWIRAVIATESGGDLKAVLTQGRDGAYAAHAGHMGRHEFGLWVRHRSL